MTFRMRRSARNNVQCEQIPSTGQKIADKIDLEPAKLKDYGGRFLYYPTQIPKEHINSLESLQPKSTEEYLQDLRPGLLLEKPEYTREEMVFDKSSGRWKLVNESELYKYQV